MKNETRLRVVVVILILSLVYGTILSISYELASAIAAGYVAIVLTALVLINVWRHP